MALGLINLSVTICTMCLNLTQLCHLSGVYRMILRNLGQQQLFANEALVFVEETMCCSETSVNYQTARCYLFTDTWLYVHQSKHRTCEVRLRLVSFFEQNTKPYFWPQKYVLAGGWGRQKKIVTEVISSRFISLRSFIGRSSYFFTGVFPLPSHCTFVSQTTNATRITTLTSAFDRLVLAGLLKRLQVCVWDRGRVSEREVCVCVCVCWSSGGAPRAGNHRFAGYAAATVRRDHWHHH
jgi:hypothetical protein